jgi:hypothetical protein
MIGVLALSFCTATVMFGRYSLKTRYDLNLFDTDYSIYSLPQYVFNSLPPKAQAIAVFSALGLVISLVFIVLGAIPGKIVGSLFVGGLFLMVLSAIIAESLFYHAFIYDYSPLYSPDSDDYPYEVIKNKTKVQKYIKKSIKELYEHAYELIYGDPSINSTGLLEWKQISKEFLGSKEIVDSQITGKVYQYSDLFQGQTNNPSLSETVISLYIPRNSNYIVAQTGRMDNYINVASLSFCSNGVITTKAQYCWLHNSRRELSCKVIESDPAKTSPQFSTSNYLLETYLVSGDYLSLEDQKYSMFYANYLISFPVGYILISPNEATGCFDEFSRSYSGLSVKKELQKYISSREHNEAYDKRFAYDCTVEPRSYEDVASVCSSSPIALYTLAQDENNINSPFANVGKYPGWAKANARAILKGYVFEYGLGQEVLLVRLSLALIITEVVAIVILLMSSVFGLFGDSGTQGA